MPVYRDKWSAQQQVARRHLVEQTSNTLGVADQDTTLRPNYSAANPYQLRWRDSTVMALSASAQFMRHTLNSNDLGVADQDLTLRPPWQGSPTLRWRDLGTAYVQAWRAWDEDRRSGTELDVSAPDADPTVTLLPWRAMNPYQLRWRDSAVTAVEATRQWFAERLTSNDLGVADQDTSIRPLWAAANPYQLRWRDSAVDAVGAQEGWLRRTLNSNDLGVADQDLTLRPVWAMSNPYTLWWRFSTLDAIEANRDWWGTRLTGNDLGVPDQDVTLRPPWQQANPYQLRRPPNDMPAIQSWLAFVHLLEQSTPVEDSADPTRHQPWGYANPYQLRQPPNDVPAIEAWLQQLHRWESTVPPPGAVDADPTLTVRRPQNPYQLWARPPSPVLPTVAFLRRQGGTTPVEDSADPTLRRPWAHAHPYQLWRREVLVRVRIAVALGLPVVLTPGGTAITLGGSGLATVTGRGSAESSTVTYSLGLVTTSAQPTTGGATTSVEPAPGGSATSQASES